jgi:serine/threonine protein phosphatase PrpC
VSKIKSVGKSDVGLKRPNNEDAFLVDPERGFSVLADGMGGAAAGEIASRIFVKTSIKVLLDKSARFSGEGVPERVREVFELANRTIFEHAAENPECQGMGCTAELLAFDGQRFVLGHVGDSRTYLFRQGELRQLTRDHSLVQDQIDQGLITPVEARRHSLRNVILRAVGVNERLAVDLISGTSVSGDLFLLCSDGLTDMVDDPSIREALLTSPDLDRKVEGLIELAKSAGGHDNITVILCEMMDSH